MSISYQKYCICEQKFDWYFPKPVYHPKNKEIIIISTQFAEQNTKGIYEYNMKKNIFNKIYTYNKTLTPFYHGQLIDAKNELLYIFSYGKLGIFDLNTKKMNINTQNELCNFSICPQSIYIPSPINKSHILSDSTHWIINMNNKIIDKIKINKFQNNNIIHPNILYIPFTQQLISFGSENNNKIWYCNIKQLSKKQKYNWQLYHLKMPYTTEINFFDILLVFNNIIFIFYFIENSYHDIWCIDLLNNKLIKTKYNTPTFNTYRYNIYAMKDNNNNVHIINFIFGEKYIFNLHNLIPKEIITLHRKYYTPLIIGYIKQEENKNNFLSNIPYVLKQLILYYFPLFI